MIIIGITGSIGMGKSTIASMLNKLRIPIHDSDKIIKFLLEENKIIINKIKIKWPSCIIGNKKEEKINKEELGKIVFYNNKEKKELEKLLHPLVVKNRNDFFKKNKNKMIVGIDVPLLYETKTDEICNYIFLASASKDVQQKRVLKRTNMDDKKFQKIKENQMSDFEKKKRKPIIIPTGYGKLITFVTVVINLLFIIIKTKSIKT